MKFALLTSDDSPYTAPSLRAFLEIGLEPTAVLVDDKRWTQSDKDLQVDRVGTLELAPPLGELLTGRKIPFFHVENHSKEFCVELVEELELELLVNANSPRILRKEILDVTPRGILGVHPGLLPEYRGCSCVEWAVFNQDPVGNSVFFLTEGVDEGPVVMTEEMSFRKTDAYQDLRRKVVLRGFELLAKGCRKVFDENLSCRCLDSSSGGKSYPAMKGEKLQAVKDRLSQGEYKYQLEDSK